jgi:hypothetical protein
MTNREDVFTTWVPPGGIWSLWARPVLFAQMVEAPLGATVATVPLIDVSWVPRVGDSAVEPAVMVIDLPGEEAVRTGVALAGRGYRAVPLFNACTDSNEVLEQTSIITALRAGVETLASTPLPADAPPAFLLDARRLGEGLPAGPGTFDNRWKTFPQDFPSAGFLLARGFRRAVLVQRHDREPREDLVHVLRRWQDAGIVIDAKDVTDKQSPRPIDVPRPAWYRLAWERTLSMLGLRLGWRGGFGDRIPEARHG